MTQPKPISFSEAERLSEIFDSANREDWQRTSFILKTLNLSPDSVIADVGAGTGYFSSQFSDLVPQGFVYAIDAEPNMVSYMNTRFEQEQRTNIQTTLCQRDNPCLPEKLDVVFLANVYRFIQDRDNYLARIFEQTDHNTRIVFVDFRQSHARVSPEQAMKEVTGAGFVIDDIDMSSCPDHYILSFRKPLAA